jgi:L-ascorbate metabolism protein UlaG (beta-lactamase superfamily)
MKIIKKMFFYLFVFVIFLAFATYLFLQQAAFGKAPSGTRLEKIKLSTNYKNGKFQNIEPTTVASPEMDYWALFKMYAFDTTEVTPPQKLPAQKNNLAYPEDKTKPKLTWFGHSSILLQVDATNILIDPVFSLRASPVQYAGSKSYDGTMLYTIADFPTIDFVLISHDHYDHLDYASIVQLKDKAKMFYVPLGVGSHLEKWGIDTAKIVELDWWQSVNPNPQIQVVATPARHFSGRSLGTEATTLWASYVIKTTKHSIYFGGDSGYGEHFKEIGKRYGGFDITMLEAGQYNKFWASIHMMPEETVQAHIDLGGKMLLPIHWGKFTLALHAWDEPIQRILAKATQTNSTIITPMIGEPVFLDSINPTKHWWKLQ